jgi:tol-pal system protein YbgF
MPHPAAAAPRRRFVGATRRAAGTVPGAVALAAAAALAVVLGAAPERAARADETIAELRRERDGIALQLAQMRRLVPEEGAATVEPAPLPRGPADPFAQAPPALPLDEARRAGFEVRLGQLEELLRGLTGRIEQLEFEQRRVNERLDRLVADLDVRLSALEAGGGRGGGGGAAAEEAGDRAAAATPSPESEERNLLDRLPSGAELAAPAPEAATTPAAPAITGGTAEAGDPITRYHAAMDLLRAGDYAAAETALAALVAAHPDHEVTANAAYWLAETHYVRKNYAEAAATFARNYRTYGADAAKAPDNLLKLGMSLEALGDTERACQVFAELGNAFPEAPAHIEQAVARERSRAGCA